MTHLRYRSSPPEPPPEAVMPALHYHAFAYTGKGYTDREVAAGLAPPSFPPLVVGMGNRKSVATFKSVDEAIGWLEKEMTTHEPTDAKGFPVSVRMEYSRARLQLPRNNAVIHGYWTRSQYVSRQLFPCDQSGCPSA
jgi:hypothetical protein